MKKLYYLIILTVILGLVLAGCFLSNVGQVPTSEQSGIAYLTRGTPGDPDVFTLYAGQHIDVGTVEVWDDTTNLYVRYVVNDPWRLTETHLHVAAVPGDIPQTKKGNPIPGQFEYKGEHDCVEEYTYIIPVTWVWDPCGLYIAAHAVVVKPIEEYWEEVWQIGDVEVISAVNGWLENYADEFNWGFPAGPTTPGPNLGVEEPGFTNPFIVGGLTPTPISEFPYNSNAGFPYATDFDVQWEGGLPFGGLLTISWSPGQSADEIKEVRIDGVLVDTLNATGTPSPGEGWFWNTYPLVEDSVDVNPLPDGWHTINFQHTKGDGTFWDWVRLEKPCEQEETAWANGDRFNDKNWATYFNYRMQEDLWQIGTPDGAINPTVGSDEYPADEEYSPEFLYVVGNDIDPIGAPAIPGYIALKNVCDISPRPLCTKTTEILNIQFELHCNYAEGELTLIYDRYGSEFDILYFDEIYLDRISATEGNFGHHQFSLPQADAGLHTITIIYDGGGSGNGHYIDYLKLVNY